MADRQVIADFARSMGIATSGLRAQAARIRVISENIANADSTAATPGGDPYRRKIPTFASELDRTLDAKVVTLGRVAADPSDFRIKHDPGNPAADENGFVKMPNVDVQTELADMREANRTYEANLQVAKQSAELLTMTTNLLKDA